MIPGTIHPPSPQGKKKKQNKKQIDIPSIWKRLLFPNFLCLGELGFYMTNEAQLNASETLLGGESFPKGNMKQLVPKTFNIS